MIALQCASVFPKQIRIVQGPVDTNQRAVRVRSRKTTEVPSRKTDLAVGKRRIEVELTVRHRCNGLFGNTLKVTDYKRVEHNLERDPSNVNFKGQEVYNSHSQIRRISFQVVLDSFVIGDFERVPEESVAPMTHRE